MTGRSRARDAQIQALGLVKPQVEASCLASVHLHGRDPRLVSAAEAVARELLLVDTPIAGTARVVMHW